MCVCVCVCVCVCAHARTHSVMSDSYDLMNYSLPGCYVHGIFQAIILEWVVINFESLMSPALAGGFFTIVTPGKPTAQGYLK